MHGDERGSAQAVHSLTDAASEAGSRPVTILERGRRSYFSPVPMPRQRLDTPDPNPGEQRRQSGAETTEPGRSEAQRRQSGQQNDCRPRTPEVCFWSVFRVAVGFWANVVRGGDGRPNAPPVIASIVDNGAFDVLARILEFVSVAGHRRGHPPSCLPWSGD